MTIRVFVVLLVCLLSACGAQDSSTEAPSPFKTTLAAELSSRVISVPMPVRIEGGAVVLDGSGRPVPQWDGSMVDLFAADAWAQCAAAVDSDADNEVDTYTSKLRTHIWSASCPNANPPPYAQLTVVGCTPENCSAVKRWARQRETLACNVDPDTRVSSAARFYPNTTDFSALPKLPPVSHFTDVRASSPEMLAKAHRRAQGVVDSASVNLCMAQRLREYIASADSLLLSADDQQQLLDVVRTRVQAAMVRYAQIGRALTNPDDRPENMITGEEQVFPLFLSWGKNVGYGLQAIGRDFGAAIKLHLEATTEEAKLLARASSARMARNNKPRGTPAEDWGAASWRQQLLALMYGRAPQPASATELDFSEPGTTVQRPESGSWLDRAWPNQYPPLSSSSYYVKTDASDPNVEMLLGLARRADALLFKERIQVGSIFSLPFHRVDVEPSADQLYRSVDAWIWTQDCIKAGNPTCVVRPNDPRIPPTSQFEKSLLFKRYGVTLNQAKTLVSLVSDMMSRRQFDETLRDVLFPDPILAAPSAGIQPDDITEVEGAFHVLGKHATLTGAALEARAPGATGVWYHLDKDFRTEAFSLTEQAPLYSEFSPTWIPRVFDEWGGATNQGLGPSWWDSSGPVDMGALSALGTAWDFITASISNASATLKSDYFQSAAASLDAIDAAIGATSASIRPVVRMVQAQGFCPGLSGIPENGWCLTPAQTSSADGNKVWWEVALRVKTDDPFFSGGDVKLIAVTPHGLEATAALDPNFVSVGGKTRADYLVNAKVGTGALVASQPRSDGTKQHSYQIQLPALDPRMGNASEHTYYLRTPSYYSFFLQRTVAGVDEYRLVGRRVGLHVRFEQKIVDPSNPHEELLYTPIEGQQFAYGGTLGTLVAKVWAPHPRNASKPAFDGFGFTTDWVPPVDPSLYATTSAPNAIAYYLSSARTAADEATMAVKGAVEQLLREQADEATRQIAEKKAQQIDVLEQRALCGDANPNCDTSTSPANILNEIKCVDPTPDEWWVCEKAVEGFRSVLPKEGLFARAVLSHINDESPPAFQEYSGGTFQRVLLSQWSAFKRMSRAARDAVAAAKARNAEMALAHAELESAQQTKAAECRKEAFELAFKDGFSYTGGWLYGSIQATDDGFEKGRISEIDSKSFSIGPLRQQGRLCDDAKKSLPLATAKRASVIADGWAWLSTATTTVLDASSGFQLATMDLLKVKQETKLAKAKANLEASLAADGLTTRYGTSRRYHSLDMWRAQALLESARRYAITARRAIEARYVVDLSRMRADETFVAAPATWADEVYQYDLNAPAAVGLATRGDIGGGALYANVLSDYVQNLTRFVDGYAVSRPTAAVASDADVLPLVGPDVRETVTVNGQPVSVLAEGTRAWDFYCADTAKWIMHPGAGQVPTTASLMTACNGAAPTKARLTFTLDPWGRLNGDAVSPPYEARYNARWKRLATNFVGQGVLDCSFAANAAECSSRPYIPYHLGFTGPVWVTDFNQQWKLLAVPSGRIEAAKALAGQWFDPIDNGWGNSSAVAIARQEFDQRPLGGAYELEFDVRPEVRLDRLEFIQVLTETAYWVKQ